MMVSRLFIATVLLLLISFSAQAQQSGPNVEHCKKVEVVANEAATRGLAALMEVILDGGEIEDGLQEYYAIVEKEFSGHGVDDMLIKVVADSRASGGNLTAPVLAGFARARCMDETLPGLDKSLQAVMACNRNPQAYECVQKVVGK